jgi:hypothetical protein
MGSYSGSGTLNIGILCTAGEWKVRVQLSQDILVEGSKAASPCPAGDYSNGCSVTSGSAILACCPSTCDCPATYYGTVSSDGSGVLCTRAYGVVVAMTVDQANPCAWSGITYFTDGGFDWKLEMGISCVEVNVDGTILFKWNLGAGLFIADGPYWVFACAYGAYKDLTSCPAGSYDACGGNVYA